MRAIRFLYPALALVLLALLGITLRDDQSTSAGLLAVKTPQRVNLPIILSSCCVPPPATTSRYMQTISTLTFYNEGCAMGSLGTSGVVILDFGQPWLEGTTYGTNLFDAPTFSFASVSQIEAAAKEFAHGYYQCSPPWSRLDLGIGTSNCSSGGGGCLPGGGNVSYGHGRAWAQMVNNVSSYVQVQGWGSQVLVDAANDIEPGWSYALDARSWVDGYTSAATRHYFDYGTCDACPYFNCLACSPCFTRSVLWCWTLEDIRWVSSGAPPANPLPEIYLTNGGNADQWYRMSLYSYLSTGYRMPFQGAFTTWQACQERGPCPGFDNTPAAGWTQLWNATRADPRTSLSTLPWSTDITWQQ